MNRQIRRNKKVNKKNIRMVNPRVSDDGNDIKRFIVIVGVMLALLLGLYLITDKVKNKDNKKANMVEINYDIMNIGSLMNAPYDNYYVVIYNKEDNNSAIYNSILDEYNERSNEKDHIKMYYIDLNNKLNESYYNKDNDNKSNPNAKSISELDLGDFTLIEIRNKKIVKYIEDFDKIIKELNINNQ